MATEAEIRSAYNQYLKRDPDPSDIERFANTSGWNLKQYIMGQIAYNDSNEYKDRAATLEEYALQIFGHELGLQYLDNLIRSGVSDTVILYHWRQSPEYRSMFTGKPEFMSESQYRTAREKAVTDQFDTQAAFQEYAGKTLTFDELNKIYYGGPWSEAIRRQYAQVQGMKASREATRGKLQTAAVKETPLGPVQPALGNYLQAATATSPLQSVPDSQRWRSYADYVQGISNPGWRPRSRSLTPLAPVV